MNFKKLYFKLSIIVMAMFGLTMSSCEKENEKLVQLEIPSIELFSLGSNSVTIKSALIKSKDSIPSQGLCWSTNPNPITLDENVKAFLYDSLMYFRIENLLPNTKYYAKLFAINSNNTWYGDELEFTTSNTTNDIEGNIYNTVKIGSQVWMVENLRTTKYNDGTDIPYFNSNSNLEWPENDFVCWYEFRIGFNMYVYGGLYNWAAVSSGKLCPTGWHVPNDEEWQTLVNYLGGKYKAGGLMKDKLFWNNNFGANNLSGFMARGGGGACNSAPYFLGKEHKGYWWSTTIDNTLNVTMGWNIYWEIFNETSEIGRNGFQTTAGDFNALSVRCIKD